MAARVRPSLAARWESLLDLVERRLPALTRRRAAEPLPIALHSRRVYVVPTRFGLFFGATLVAMLLGALNFDNNSALLLTFVIMGTALISLYRTVANLRGIRLDAVRAAPVHAGETLLLVLEVDAGERGRSRVLLAREGHEAIVDFGPGPGEASLPVPTARRGWLRVGRITASTSHPFGLFHAWSVLHPDTALLVYPKPEDGAPRLPRAPSSQRGPELRAEGEDWQGLRDYRPGDAPRLIAWKASARQDRMLVKEFSEPLAAEVTLAWDALGALAHEQRIARLTRWVLDASAQNLPFRLVLPALALGPARGSVHTTRCLRELALLP